MSKSRPEKTPVEKTSPLAQPAEQRVLRMELQPGDWLTDETAEYEVIGRPYTTNGGKDAHVRVKKVDQPDVTVLRTWGTHERVSVKRAPEEGKR